MNMVISGTGSAVPKLLVTNDDLGRLMDTSDAWIQSRTGIRNRRLAVEETTTGLAVGASLEALADEGIAAEDLDLILAATVTPDQFLPNLACEVQGALGASGAVAFDVNAACSGFLFALDTAALYLKNLCERTPDGADRTALVIGAETLSKIMDWNDRSTCVLFGDGAGAAVLRAQPSGSEKRGIRGMVQRSDGARGGVLSCRNRPVNHPYAKRQEPPAYVSMDGQEVYRFAVRTVPETIREAVDQAGFSMDDIDLFLLHQANLRILESVAKRLKQPMEKFPVNLDEYGNTSAASVPILLDDVRKQGKIKEGSRIVLAGFGAGLTCGATVLVW